MIEALSSVDPLLCPDRVSLLVFLCKSGGRRNF